MNGMNETEQRTRDIGHTHTHMIPCFIFFFCGEREGHSEEYEGEVERNKKTRTELK